MRLIIFFLLLSISIIGCNYSNNKKIIVLSNAAVDSLKRLNMENYPTTKKNIVAYVYRNCSVNEIPHLQKVFISVVCDSIIPYWIGTKWNFNGITEIPQQGTIACGYFVATVLRDAGVKLNRIALSQCASEELIQKLISKKYIHRYRNISQEAFIAAIRHTGKGLYIVGLDNHTGFIYYANDGIWFIHSSYITPGSVARQDAVYNSILTSSKYKVTGKLSDDETFLKWWYRHLTSGV